MCNSELDITRMRVLEGYCLPPFKGEHIEQAQTTSQLTPNLPQGQAPRFPYGCLNISSSPIYSHYDWVDHRWGYLGIAYILYLDVVNKSFMGCWFNLS